MYSYTEIGVFLGCMELSIASLCIRICILLFQDGSNNNKSYQEVCYSDNISDFFLQKVSVQILARTLAILTELLCGFASQLHDLAALPSGKELSILN